MESCSRQLSPSISAGDSGLSGTNFSRACVGVCGVYVCFVCGCEVFICLANVVSYRLATLDNLQRTLLLW